MRINGKTYAGPYIKTIVIPRGEDKMIFKVQAILDYSDFEALCPRPVAPMIKKRTGETFYDVEDADFKAKINDFATKRTHFLVLKSLAATEGLEWEQVNMSDPDTWSKYQDELQAAGLTSAEVAYIMDCVIEVNGLDDKKIKEATEAFLSEAAEEPQEE